MYSIAVSVAACLRGGTRVDVAWSLDPGLTPRFDPNDAVGLTPGGGRLGALLDGALDSRLDELAATRPSAGRIVEIEVDAFEASSIGVEVGTRLRLLLAPADTLPAALWEHLVDRDAVGLSTRLDGGVAIGHDLALPEDAAGVRVAETEIVTTWSPRSTLLVMGGGPMAEGVAEAASFIGWNVVALPTPDAAVGVAATLSPIDGVVVVGHDVEATGRVLHAALGSRAGYLGSLGPSAVRTAREDWLGYRGVTDTSRISSPAGVPIGARAPREVGIAVVAEMIAKQASTTR